MTGPTTGERRRSTASWAAEASNQRALVALRVLSEVLADPLLIGDYDRDVRRELVDLLEHLIQGVRDRDESSAGFGVHAASPPAAHETKVGEPVRESVGVDADRHGGRGGGEPDQVVHFVGVRVTHLLDEADLEPHPSSVSEGLVDLGHEQGDPLVAFSDVDLQVVEAGSDSQGAHVGASCSSVGEISEGTSAAGPAGPAAPFGLDDAPPRSDLPTRFLRLDDVVSVLPDEVAAVTSSDNLTSRVYLRGAGRTYLEVRAPLAEVVTALERSLAPSPDGP